MANVLLCNAKTSYSYSFYHLQNSTPHIIGSAYIYAKSITIYNPTPSTYSASSHGAEYLLINISEQQDNYFKATLEYYDDSNTLVYTQSISQFASCSGEGYFRDNTYVNDANISRMNATRLNPLTIVVNNTHCSVDAVNPSILQIEKYSPNIDTIGSVITASFTAETDYTFTNTTQEVIINGTSMNVGFTLANTNAYFSSENVSIGKTILYINDVTINVEGYYTSPLTITNSLTDVSNNNPATSIQYGLSYTATLTASVGKYISYISIKMDGVEIVEDVYENGVINIPRVTGDILIVAMAQDNPTISYTLTGCTSSNTATSIQYGASYDAIITADNNYSMEDANVLITMDGVELFDVYENGEIHIPSVTGNLVIIIVATTYKTFTFKSMDGNVTYLTLSLVKIRTIFFTINGNTRTLRVNGVDYTWVNIVPSDKVLAGLSFSANSNRYSIPINVEVAVNYDEPLTFYEVLLDAQEQADYFSLMLYKNSAEPERVDKTDLLEYVGTISGVLRSIASILNPQITIEYEGVINFNYVYIAIFNRYYFVTNVTYGVKKLVTLSLKVDVLMTYRLEIYSQSGLIARNENTFNDMLIDNERIIENDPVIDVAQSDTGFFNTNENNVQIVVNVIGGE